MKILIREDKVDTEDGCSWIRKQYSDESYKWFTSSGDDVVDVPKDDEDFAYFNIEKMLEKPFQKLIKKLMGTNLY